MSVRVCVRPCVLVANGSLDLAARATVLQASCMQSSCAHDAPHFTVQALRAREKRAVFLPSAFGLLASVAGWTGCARTRGGRGVRDARIIFNAHHVS